MGFLDEKLSDLSLADLQRLISREVAVQVPALPAGLAAALDAMKASSPILAPPTSTSDSGSVVTYNGGTGGYTVTPPTSLAHTDGLAPGPVLAAPAVVGAPGLLVATWSPVLVNSAGATQKDPVTYDVYLSLDGISFTLYASLSGTTIVMRQMPDGTAFAYLDGAGNPVPYYVQVIAKDADGAAAASPTGANSLVQVTHFDIQAGSIKADLLETQLILASAIILGTPLTTRIEITSSGIDAYSDATTRTVHIPSDGSDSFFKGTLETGALTINGGMTINGSNNIFNQGAVITLNEKQADPVVKPTVDFNNPKGFTFTVPSGFAGVQQIEYDAVNDRYWGLSEKTSNSNLYLMYWDNAGAHLGHLLVQTSSTTTNASYGLTLLGGVLYLLYFIVTDGTYRIGKITNPTNTGTWTFATIANIGSSHFTPANGAALTNDGTNLCIASFKGAGSGVVIRVSTYSILGVFGASTDLTSGIVQSVGITRSVRDAAYDGTNWFVYTYDTAGYTLFEKYVASTHALVTDSGAEFTGFGNTGFFTPGVTYNSLTTLPVIQQAGIQYKPTAFTWASASGSKFFVGYSWSDGTHESIESPVTTVNLAGTTYPHRYGRVTVTVPTFPSSITAVKFFAFQNASAPSAAASWQQTSPTNVDSTVLATFHWIQFLGSGSHDITPSTFVGSGIANMVPAASSYTAGWRIDGSGIFRPSRATLTQRDALAGPTVGDLVENVTTRNLDSYDIGGWSPAGFINPSRYAYWYDDFMAPTANALDNYGIIAPVGGAVAPAADTADTGTGHAGIVSMTTGTTVNATGATGLRYGGTSGSVAGRPIQLGGGIVRAGALIKLGAITTPFVDIVFGMTAQGTISNAFGGTGFVLRHNGNVNSANWQKGIGDNTAGPSTMTLTDTGVAGAGGTWYLLEMVIAADAKSCQFFINGVSAGSSSSATAQISNPVFWEVTISKVTSIGTARPLLIDAMYVLADVGARF